MSEASEKAKLVIIGAGPGGYVAAIRAAQIGESVVVVEKQFVGGTCLNWGCIPTKAMLACTEVLDSIKEAESFGISVGEVKADLAKIVERKNAVSAQLRKGIQQLFKANGIKLINGEGYIKDSGTVGVRTEEGEISIETEAIIIATGSEPARLPAFDFDQPSVLTSTEGLELTEIPKKMIIVGSGVVGSEFATVFSSLGTEVVMLELLNRILPTEDERIAQQMKRILSKRGIKIMTETTIDEVTEYKPDSITVKLSNGETLSADKLLVSIGRSLNTKNIGLEDAGIKTGERGEILVNSKMETNVSGIYAIGDAVGGILLAHMASAEGVVAAENAMGMDSEIDYSVVPSCVFTEPEIASVGITPKKAEEEGIEVKTGMFMFGAIGKALAMGKGAGFVQLVTDKTTDKVLGGQIMGPHASDLIHEIALAAKKGLTAEDIGGTIHAHPTLAEAVMEAAEAVHGKAVHAAPAKKK